jgi:ABC-type bacteriocin/lantibiotic exporter with double-glycine peptidase domain
MKSKDARIQISSKLFYNIRNIKLNSLEEIYAEKINEKRLNEIKYFSKLQYLQLLLNSIQFSLPPIVSVISILFYRLNIFNETREEEKEMSDTLSDINIFYQITLLIFTLPDFFISLFNNLVSIKRLEEFLFFEEIFEYKNENNFSIDDISISMNNCNFGIKKDNLILLNNINIEIKKGELIGICGNIGSGKSNFLNAIINNLDLLEISENETNIKINGKIHYIPQIPFIINDTCLNNLIFHKKYLKERYKKIDDICQLEEDFLMMKGGDNNEIGESGYNLSS